MFIRSLLSFLLFAFGFTASANAGNAPVPITTTTVKKKDSDETVFSIGLRFSFGDMAPEVVGAVRNTTTSKDSDVTGIQGDIAVPVSGQNQFKPKVRVLGLWGNRDVLGQAGVGFNFGSGQGLVAGGVQGQYVEGGANLEMDGKFDPYAGLNLFDRPSGPDKKIITTTTNQLIFKRPPSRCLGLSVPRCDS